MLSAVYTFVFLFVFIFALLIGNAAAGFASGLTRGLALAAAAVLCALAKIFCFQGFDEFHDSYPPIKIISCIYCITFFSASQ